MSLFSLHDVGVLYSTSHQLYLGCRWSTLLSVAMQLVALNQTVGINCQVRSLDLVADLVG
jgi:hypothetical protein